MTNPWLNEPASIPDDALGWMTPEIREALNGHNYPLNKDGMLMLWQKGQEQLQKWKELEMEWRKICAAMLVPAKTEGTVNVPLGDSHQAKVVHKYNYKPKADNKDIWAGLEKIENIGNEGKFIAERLFSWTPNFLKTEYITLKEQAENGSQSAAAIVKIIEEELIVIEDAAPTLTIAPVKKGKK